MIKIDQANSQINLINDRVLPLLETLTGQKLGADPDSWRKWWTEQLGYVYEDRYGTKPTLTDSVYTPDLTVVAPVSSWDPAAHRLLWGGDIGPHD